jgi:ribulose 1,5-bisphosphate carboxylase large subunit-like protein
MHAVIDRQKNHGMHFRVLAKALCMSGYLELLHELCFTNFIMEQLHKKFGVYGASI